MKIELGSTMKDKITGFQGVVTGYCQYITGCNQALLVPKVDKDGKSVDGHWYDEQRLELLETPIIKIDNGSNPGCDTPAPNRG